MTLKEKLHLETKKGTVFWAVPVNLREMLHLKATIPEIEAALDELGYKYKMSAHHRMYALRLRGPDEVVKRTRK